MNPLTMILLCGIPGSGKSTHAAAFLLNNPEYTHICPDLMRQHFTGDTSNQSLDSYIWGSVVPQTIRATARMRQSCLFDSTAYSRKSRKSLIKIAKGEGYRIVAHVMRTPYEECVRRNAARERKVPLSVLEKMHKGWHEPALDEGIDEIVDIQPIPLDTVPQA